MSGSIYFRMKTKLKKSDLEGLAEKIGEKHIIEKFDRSGETAPKGKRCFLLINTKKNNGIRLFIYFYYYDSLGSYEPKETVDLLVSVGRHYGWQGKTDEIIKFASWVAELVNATEFIGGYDDDITVGYVSVIGIKNDLQELSDFMHFLSNNTDLKAKNIPPPKKLFELVKENSVKKEKIGNFTVYYLFPKQYEAPSIWWPTKRPDFYNQFLEEVKNK